MILAEATWQEIEVISRDTIVLIPTGAMEQHGWHLPLITDSLIVEEVCKGVERNLAATVLLCPTLWLGASSSHLSFAGTLSATFEGYDSALTAVIDSLIQHRFHKFYVLNGHGGNSDLNRIVLRRLKQSHPNHQFAHATYFELIETVLGEGLLGPSKRMTHGGEAETSLLLHLRPELVRMDLTRRDGMKGEPEVLGLVLQFDELSESGSVGDPSVATAETGAEIFKAAVSAATLQIARLTQTLVMVEIETSNIEKT